MARDHRRLAAIVSLDVAGYSRLIGVDDSGTLAALKAHRRELIDRKIAEHDGRIVKTTGDGLLLEFPSVVDAVRCAVEVQRGMAERNAGVAVDKRLDFRVGINVGDIIIDGDDIFGDGVNVAARLETLADPGQICVSKVVRDQVLDKLSFTFEDLGAKKVKNIARPIEAYRVVLGTKTPPTPGVRKPWERLARLGARKWIVGTALVFGIAGVLVWVTPQIRNAARLPEPPALSLVVLRFTGTPVDQPLADEVTQEIASALRRTAPYLTVVSQSGAMAETSRNFDTRAIGHERNVRYVLVGSVRVEGDTARAAARLIDAETATQTWAGQFAAVRSQLFAPSDTGAWGFIRDLRDAVWRAEQQRVSSGTARTRSTPADLVLRASVQERHRTPQRLAEARKLADEALRLDPNSVLALRERVLINMLIWENDPTANRVQLAQEADEFARRALAIDRTDPGIWRDRAAALGLLGRWDAAMDAMAEARRLDPSHLGDVVYRSWMLSMTGRADEALRISEDALAHEPSLDTDPNFRHNQCYAQLLLGLFGKAVPTCEKSAAGGDDWWPYFFLTVAYAQSGDMAKAATSKAELLKRRPDFTIAQLNAMGLSDNPVYLKQAETNVVPGLRKAGISEN